MTDEEIWLQAYAAIIPVYSSSTASEAGDLAIEAFHKRFPKSEYGTCFTPDMWHVEGNRYNELLAAEKRVIELEARVANLSSDYARMGADLTSAIFIREAIKNEAASWKSRAEKAEVIKHEATRCSAAGSWHVPVAEYNQLLEAKGRANALRNEADAWKGAADMWEKRAMGAEAELAAVKRQALTYAGRLPPNNELNVVELRNAKLGDVVEIFLAEDGKPSVKRTNRRVAGRVFAVAKAARGCHPIAVGWSKEQLRPACIDSFTGQHNTEGWRFLPDTSKVKHYHCFSSGDQVDCIIHPVDTSIDRWGNIIPAPEVKEASAEPVAVEEPKTNSLGAMIGLAAASLIGAGITAIADAGKTDGTRVAESVETDAIETQVEASEEVL